MVVENCPSRQRGETLLPFFRLPLRDSESALLQVSSTARRQFLKRRGDGKLGKPRPRENTSGHAFDMSVVDSGSADPEHLTSPKY